MNNQTKIAFKTLFNLYGSPDWAESPQRASVEQEWDNSLQRYSEEQVRRACLRFAKYRKSKIFPPLALIEAELVDEEYNEENQDKKVLAEKAYQYYFSHKQECDPVPTELTMKQVIWRSYGVSVGGFDPKRDGTLD